MSTRGLLSAVMTAALAAASVAPTRTGDWPRWRGAAFDGRAATESALLSRPFALRPRWKRALGPGYSGVVVAGGHAVTMFSDGANDVVVALAADSGVEQWRVALGPTFPGRDGSAGGPVSTPAIDGGGVFAIGPHGDVVAVNAADGRLLWKRHLVGDFGAVEPHWGFTTSPLLTGDVVVVFAGGSPGNAVVALDRRTGATVWTAGSDTVSYQSPVLTGIDGSTRIVGAGDQFLFALDPRDGREIWKYEHRGTGFYGRIINPVVTAGGLLLTWKPDQSVLLALSGAAPPSVAWTTRELKLSYATPVAGGGTIFGYSGAFLTAIDAATGAIKWRSRAPGDGFPILVDDHLVVLTKEGHLVVADAAAGGFTPRADLELFSQLVWAPPSFADGRFYARDSYRDVAAVDVIPADTMTVSAPRAVERGRLPGSAFDRWVGDTARAADAAERVTRFIGEQRAFPAIEGERTAHILYAGDGRNVLLRSDALGTGVEWPLHQVGSTGLWYVSLDLEPDARVSYQFVSPAGEPMVDPRNPTKATSQNFPGDVSLLLMPRADRALPAPSSALKGRLLDLEFDAGTAAAEHLRWGGKKQVHVYLPPGYDADPARRYPAIYVMYGDEMLGGGHLAAALDRAMPESVRASLVVFVQNTSGYEYARTFRDVHARMFAERLIPWIDGRFRTVTRPSDRVIVGADEAGFAAVEMTLRYRAVFGNAVAMSLFPLSAGGDELLQRIESAPRGPERFHIDWGRYDPRRASDQLDVPAFSQRVRDRLQARGFAVSGGPTSDGSTVVFWSARAVQALRTLWPAR